MINPNLDHLSPMESCVQWHLVDFYRNLKMVQLGLSPPERVCVPKRKGVSAPETPRSSPGHSITAGGPAKNNDHPLSPRGYWNEFP